jgi:serine phosphatase RsbU (regulator of sigma subunit)
MEKTQVRVLALYNDSLFVGTREGLLKIKDGRIDFMSKKNTGLSDNYILSLLVDSQNRLWITTRNGLSLYQNGKIKKFTSDDGLVGNTLFKVYEDNDKNIWAASAGLSLFKNDKFVGIPCDKLIAGTTSVYNIVDNKNGFLWLTTDIGVIKTAKKEVLAYLLGKTTKTPFAQMFDKNDGLLSGDITANSRSFFDKNHNLWIPGRGLFFINTENYFHNNISPTVNITSVSVDENTIINLNDTLFLPPNDKMRLTIHFDAQSYIAPKKVIFQYFLEGFDNKWTTLGNKREITFTALPHGKYYFRIKACNNDGVWSENEKVLVVIISPAWYQTLAAKISLLVFIIAAIFAFIKIRTQALVKSKRELEEKVRLRTLTITEQSEELNQQASKLSLALNEISENNKVLQLFNEELTLKNQNIMDSITYARRIQASMLPKKEFIDEYFTDSFVLYKPKDVVSGDFYWTAIKKNKQETIMQMAFAVGDCTGHGVPGALLSMVGLEVLTQTANPPKMQPNIMLEKLEKGIRRTLQSEAEQSREGMEVSLCVIDLEEKNLYYSGANLPIYLFLNDEFCELTPTKKAINDTKRKAEIPFELKKMPLNGKIEIFMLSDGLKDQFGGQYDKKFSIKRIKELLEEHHQKPMKEIGELFEKEINDWMGAREQQIDDITLLGVRIFC